MALNMKMNKLMGMQAGMVILLVANLGAAWPVYEKYAEDPISQLPAVAPSGPQHVDIDVEGSGDTTELRVGLPPSNLLAWDPFKAPKMVRRGGVEEETTVAEVERPVVPIPLDNISLLGIVNLNGTYLGLVKVGGEPAQEIKRGAVLPGTDNIRCLEIRRDGLMLAQPGALNTFLPLSRPELQGQPWYRATDAGQIRGSIDLQAERRR